MFNVNPDHNLWQIKIREELGNVEPKLTENWEQLYERLNREIFTSKTPLHKAASLGCDKVVQKLVREDRCDINGLDEFEATPLAHAIWSRSKETVATLLRYEADPEQSAMYCTPLTFAIEVGKKEKSYEIANMIIRKMTKIETNIISEAATNNNVQVLNLIRARGLNLNQQDENGCNAFHQLVCSRKKISAVMREWLISNGVEVNLADKYGQTPLHWAMAYKDTEWIDFLLAHGASILTKDNDGHSPLGWGLLEGPPEVVHQAWKKNTLMWFGLNVGLPLLHLGLKVIRLKRNLFA